MGFLEDIGGFFFGWLAPEAPEPMPPGTELTSAQTDAHIGVVIGKVHKTTGNIIFKETNDGDSDDIKNDLLHIIVVWSEKVVSIDEVYVDDIPISSDNPAFFHDDGGRVVHMRNFPDGMDNYEDPLLTAAGWRLSDKASGKACSYIRLEYHGGEFAISSEPKITADLTGTTHSNPALALLDYLKDPLYGKGLSTGLINTNSFYRGRDLCDSLVDEVVGQPEQRPLFSCNCKLDTSKDILENVNVLLKPMRGWLPIIDGQLTLVIEQDDDPVSIPILEKDIIEMDGVSEGSKNKRYNRVAVTYYEPAADGTAQEAAYPPKGSALEAQLLEEDNGFINEGSVDLVTCNNFYEALEFAKTWLEISRQQTKTRIHLPKWALIYDVGDIVPVYDSFLGWEGKLFRIEQISSNKQRVTLTVREHQPYIYDFFGEGNKPEIPDTTYSFSNPDEPSDLTIEHVYSAFVQVKISWYSEASRFLYQVLDEQGLLIETDSIARYHVNLSGYALGTYRFRVMALGGLSARSGWAEIPLIMQKPGVPTDITINPTATELEVIPYLAGSDSSTAFLYSISHDLTDEEPPLPYRGPAHAYTFPGLAPERDFKIWVCSSNALGESQWTFVVARTSAVDDRWVSVIANVQWPGLPATLKDHVESITNDVSYWSTQTSEQGDNYQQLIYNVTEAVSANQINSTEIIGLKQKVGTKTVAAQFTEFKQVNIGYEDENGEWVVGAPLVRAFDEVKVVNKDGDELSVINFMQALETQLGELGGTYYLGVVDENENFTGLSIQGGNGDSDILLYMDNLRFASTAGDVFFWLNTISGRLEIGANTEFKGTMRAARKLVVLPNVMEVEDPSGFGPDNLWIWKGSPILDQNGEPDYGALTKQNASLGWRDLNGNEYFGGSVTTGQLINGGDTTLLTVNPSVIVGPFTTNGNPKQVSYGISWRGLSQEDGYCPTGETFVPSCSIVLERSLNGGAWTQVQSHQVTGELTYREMHEPELSNDPSGRVCNRIEVTNSSFTYTDTNTSQETFSYRVRVVNQQRYHVIQFIQTQNLNLISVEERPS